MSNTRALLSIAASSSEADGAALTLGDLKALQFWRRPLAFDAVDVWASDRRAFPRPFATLAAARFLARRECRLRLPGGGSEAVGWLSLPGLAVASLRDRLGRSRLRAEAEAASAALTPPSPRAPPAGTGRAVYLRSDPQALPRFGGNRRHFQGVLTALREVWGETAVLTVLPLAELPEGVDICTAEPVRRYWDHAEYGRMANGLANPARLANALGARTTAFLYQRNTAFDLTGARLARHLGVPLVLEYNGPEAWMARHWAGRPLQLEALAERMETASLRAAHLVVTVSMASRDDLLRRGVDARRIAVIPNGVDPLLFRPDVSGDLVRTKFKLGSGAVIGFSGSFGPWHGAEILAEAFADLAKRKSMQPANLHLLLIGDGPALPAVGDRLAKSGVMGSVSIAGAVSPRDMPAYLAACDVLVTPQIPNPDGSRFFGSPTKLFEYLAMGKAVVASDLEQVGEVIRESGGGSAVPPGDPRALADALEHVCSDQALRHRLGAAGAAWARAHAGWSRRMGAMLEALEACCGLT